MILAGEIRTGGTCVGAAYSDGTGTCSDVTVQGTLEITLSEYEATALLKDDKILLPRTGVTCPISPGYCSDSQVGAAVPQNMIESSSLKNLSMDSSGKIQGQSIPNTLISHCTSDQSFYSYHTSFTTT